jgi:endoglucanase
MTPLETDGIHSGVPDDRWAFTTHTTALSYDAVGALAAASRVLRGYNDKMAEECLQTAIRAWGGRCDVVHPGSKRGACRDEERE